ncbi:MAG: phosphodiesterase [Clostridia bacterium]|nr:phosphodiesterase [Clostridia bacterium]
MSELKLLIASDIHGSAFWCEKLVQAYQREQAAKLVLLGDILYHGPRNPLPDGHDPKKVVELLSAIKDEILCVRGNCDAEVDQMVLPFPVLADFALLYTGKKTLYLAHGHLANDQTTPPLGKDEILLNGHFHVPCHKQMANGRFYLNCGSVSLPKENSPHSYIVYENGEFLWKNLENGEIFDRFIP